MANHKSAKKRARQDEKKRLQNRYYKKSAKTAIKKLEAMEDHKEATAFFPKVVSMIDKLAKNGVIHKNKAANTKSRLNRLVRELASK